MGKLVKFMECKETEMEMVRSELDGAREEQLGIALDAVQQCFAESSCPDPKERMKETGMCVMGVFNDQVKPQIEAECDGAEIPEPPMEMMEMMGRKQKRKMVKKIIQKMALFGKLSKIALQNPRRSSYFYIFFSQRRSVETGGEGVK